MKLGQIYKNVVNFGKQADPRGKEGIKSHLNQVKEKFESLNDKDKEYFDEGQLWNPYNDTRILYGESDLDVSDILVGIDMEGPELLLADRLKKSNKNVDLVVSHHPEGRALATFYEVMNIQPEILKKFGVPINIAESLLDSRKKEVARTILPGNHTRAVDIASVLDIPFMCTHTVADNHVVEFLQSNIDKMKPKRVKDVFDFLCELPEYKHSRKLGVGPKIIAGDKNRQCGKVFIDMTGGTEGSKEIFKNLSQAGIGTLICMHLSESHFKKAKKEHINIVIAGHIASDNLGMNLLFDKLCKKDKNLNFTSVSGFNRIKRI